MSPLAAHLVLFAGLVSISTSGPFIVMAQMDAGVVVLWRMALGAALLAALAAARGELKVPRGAWRDLIVGAVLLAGHFHLWIKAFDLTDYASNLVLLVAQPIAAAVLAARLGEGGGRAVWLSTILATVGLAVVAGGDFALGPRALLGDALCIVAGVLIAVYYVVTRRVRQQMANSAFMAATFAVGALVSLVVVVPTVASGRGELWRYPAASWGWLAALVLVTTVVGHGLTNLAARWVRLFTLNIVIVLEPAIAIAIGWVLFGATVSATAVVGGVVLGAAVVVGLRGDQKRRSDSA